MTSQTARALPITLGMALAGASPAGADSRFEASGFVGIDYFSENIQLGNSWASEQVPGTSALVGARVAYLAVPELGRIGRVRFQLAGEAEVAIAPAFTGGSFDGSRMSYFAPVFGWRGHAMLRLGGLATLRPHLLLGAGGATVASTSPFMTKETDPVVYWG
ncbi:MAG: hypothetical protein H0T79_10390, partial [Deltaproteobacteria bacterium]|nr:hypothetical protein [Deltaproteobacteria bacterium]